MIWFDYCNLVFRGIFIRIYMSFCGFYCNWFVWKDVNLNFFIFMDVMSYSMMSSFYLMGSNLRWF